MLYCLSSTARSQLPFSALRRSLAQNEVIFEGRAPQRRVCVLRTVQLCVSGVCAGSYVEECEGEWASEVTQCGSEVLTEQSLSTVRTH